MTTYFSKSTSGFYISDIHSSIPDDAVEISEEERQALLDGQQAEEEIDSDGEGKPVLKAPTPPSLEEVVAAKRKEINTAADAVMSQVTSLYPATERESWGRQVEQAEAWVEDTNADTPYLDGILARRPSKTKAELASKILTNAAAYEALSSDVTGQRQELDDLLTTATTVEEVDAIAVLIQ